jgi:superfamily II DNA helicase RecQ
MANGDRFHTQILRQESFKENIIGLVVDEAHSISEWGTDDFRPAYKELNILIGRLPGGVPTLASSATVPPEVLDDIKYKIGLGTDYATIAYSNRKINVTLSVRILQHPQSTYADLLPVFPSGVERLEDFPQTLIYVNSRQDAELVQDFIRRHAPDWFPLQCVEFYHRHIDEERKQHIQQHIQNASLLIVAATDALGMVFFFQWSFLAETVRAWISDKLNEPGYGSSPERSFRWSRKWADASET